MIKIVAGIIFATMMTLPFGDASAKEIKSTKIYTEAQLIKFYEKAEKYLELGYYEKAIKNYSLVIDQKPNDIGCLYSRGLCYISKDQNDNAFADFSKIVALKNDSIQGHYGLGRAYTKKKEYTKALFEFDVVLEIDPVNSFAYYRKGEVYSQMGQYDKALEIANVGLAKLSKKSKMYMVMHDAHLGKGEPVLADDDMVMYHRVCVSEQ